MSREGSAGARRDGVRSNDDEVHASVRELVLRHGWNATSYQVLNPGFTYWLTPDRSAAVAYVRRHGVRVVAGAPVCEWSRLRETAAAFEQDAGDAGDRVAYFCVESRALPAMTEKRESAVSFVIGAQPVWEPRSLVHSLHDHASLRAQLNRAQNKGVRVVRTHVVSADEMRALRDCLQQWLDHRGLPALHFLVEPDTLSNLGDRVVFVAKQADVIVGFLVATPIPLRSGWLVEQIVRGYRAPNGTAEALLAQAASWMFGAKAEMVTLGLSPLSRHAPLHEASPPPSIRALFSWLRVHGRRFYNFEGLDTFKAKFRPDSWEPVYAVVPDRSGTMHALLAIGAAFGGTSAGAFVVRVAQHALGRELHSAADMVRMWKRRAAF